MTPKFNISACFSAHEIESDNAPLTHEDIVYATLLEWDGTAAGWVCRLGTVSRSSVDIPGTAACRPY